MNDKKKELILTQGQAVVLLLFVIAGFTSITLALVSVGQMNAYQNECNAHYIGIINEHLKTLEIADTFNKPPTNILPILNNNTWRD